MSGKIGLIFSIWLFSTIPSFNTLWTPNSFRHFQKLVEEGQKNMPESMNMDMEEPLIQELKIKKPSITMGKYLTRCFAF